MRTTSNLYNNDCERLIDFVISGQCYVSAEMFPLATRLGNSRLMRLDTFAPDEHASLGWRGWLLLVAVSITVCCFELGNARALTDHEIFVAGGAKQMALDHDWLLPKIGDHLWLEKPPLLHWLVIVSAKLLGGFSETTVRLPSVLAGVGVVTVMTWLSLHWFGARVAIFTALLQTTMVYFITYARLVEAEMLLAFIVVLALAVFVRWHRIGGAWPPPPRHLPLLFWGLVGLSNMAKGLGFGPVLILAPCLGFLIWQRDRVGWRRMISWPGLALGCTIALAWPIIVVLRAPEARELWRAEIVRRAVGEAGYAQPPWYYLTSAPWQLLPWTLALLLAVGPSLARARRHADSPDRFIWCWGIVPIALLSLFHGKHHHYIISCLCAFSPLCTLGLLRCGTRFAAACVAVAIGGILFVHARVLPSYDRSYYDREFLRSVRNFVPPGIPLTATSGQEIARHMFYVDPLPIGVWNPSDVARKFGNIPVFYLLTRRSMEPQLTKIGHTAVVAESQHTSKEKSPADRFTLFRIETGTLVNP